MKLKLLFCFLIVSISVKSQSTKDLKDFINKNHLAIRSVHKHMIGLNNTAYQTTFKELLKKQEESVKSFNDKPTSFYFAYSVRKECLNFLQKYSKGSLEYFELTDNEKKEGGKLSDALYSKLSKEDVKIIDALDLTNPESINQLLLTIQ